jgi:hypothetical protein
VVVLLRDYGEALARLHDRYNHDTFLWGYGHDVIFASGAAIGAGLAARVDVWRHDSASSHLQTALAVTDPVALLLAASLDDLRAHARRVTPDCGGLRRGCIAGACYDLYAGS